MSVMVSFVYQEKYFLKNQRVMWNVHQESVEIMVEMVVIEEVEGTIEDEITEEEIIEDKID
jgi:ribonucleotide reductase beta subunit family protein with ferritin-like domain